MKCETEGCPGHLGKFDCCRDEALYELTLSGFDESTGDVEAYGHHTLVMLVEPKPVDIQDGMRVVVPQGFYIVTQDNSGFVGVSSFGSEEEARAEFQRLDDEYGEWLWSVEGEGE